MLNVVLPWYLLNSCQAKVVDLKRQLDAKVHSCLSSVGSVAIRCTGQDAAEQEDQEARSRKPVSNERVRFFRRMIL